MINKVTIIGRLTKDPELRYTKEGSAVTSITLAVQRQYKNPEGEYEADFIHCTVWKKTAENLTNFCKKGSMIGLAGRLQSRHYDAEDGKRNYVTEVIAEQVQYL